MTLRLYHSPGTRSSRILWLLEELGADYELHTFATREERRADEHRGRHPLGRVPVLEDDDGFVFESVAIALHLCDLYPQAGLIPPVGSHERGLAYQWSVFAMTELEPPVTDSRRYPDTAPAVGDAPRERFAEAARAVDRALDGRDHLVGDEFSVADVLVGSALFYARGQNLLGDLPNVTSYLERLESRPARRRAYPTAS